MSKVSTTTSKVPALYVANDHDMIRVHAAPMNKPHAVQRRDE